MEPIDSQLVDALVERVVEERQALDQLNRMWQGFDEGLREDMLELHAFDVEKHSQAETELVAELAKLSPDWLRSLAYPSLMDKLSSSDADQRGKAAKGLETLGWEPANDRERALFYIATQWWSKVQALGDVAVDPLIHLVENAIQRDYLTSEDSDESNHSLRGLELASVDVGPVIRSAAALAALGQQRGLDWLSDLLAHRLRDIAVEALDALVSVGTPAAEEVFRQHVLVEWPEPIYAVRWRKPDELRKALESGSDPDIRDDRGRTSLWWAASIGDREIVEILLNAGAKPNLRSTFQETPLIAAASNDHFDVCPSVGTRR